MDSLRINILNPKARKLLESLQELGLISIKKDKKQGFKEVLERLRSKSDYAPSLDEITEEVEEVSLNRRAKNHRS